MSLGIIQIMVCWKIICCLEPDVSLAGVNFFWLSLQCAYGHRWFYVCLSRNRLHQSFHWSLQLFASFSFKRKITNDSPLGCGYQINNRKIKSRKTNKRTQTTVTLSSPSSWTIDSKCRRLLAAIKHYIRERQSRVTNAY